MEVFPLSEERIPTVAALESDRIDYHWYREHGFRVLGIHPNAYDKSSHLIVLGKELC